MKPEVLKNILRRRQELLPEANVLEVENNQPIEGMDVHIITSEPRLESFTSGADMEALVVESPDFDHAADTVIETLEPTRMERMGDIIWNAFKNKGVATAAVELERKIRRFMIQNIPAGCLWVGENAIIYRFNELADEAKKKAVGKVRFRAIVREGSLNGGMKRQWLT